MNLQDTGWKGMDWIDLGQDRDRWWGCCVCSCEPSGFIKCGEFFDEVRNY
jgi:hypothetical protein